MKKRMTLSRFIALVMAFVMLSTLVIIDNRFGLFASEDRIKTVSIEELMPEKLDKEPDAQGKIAIEDDDKKIYFAAQGDKILFEGEYFLKNFTGSEALATAGDAEEGFIKADECDEIEVEEDGNYEKAVYTKENGIYTFYGILRIVCDNDNPSITNLELLNGGVSGDVRYKEEEDFYLIKKDKSAKFKIHVTDGEGENASGIDRVVYKKDDSDTEIEVGKENDAYTAVLSATGTYRFISYDKAGNASSIKRVVIKATPGITVSNVTTTAKPETVDNLTQFISGRELFDITVEASEEVSGYDMDYWLCFNYTLENAAEPLTGRQIFSDGKATITIPAIPHDDTNKLVMWVEDEVGNTSYAFNETGVIVFVDNENPTVEVKNIELSNGQRYTVEAYNALENKWTKTMKIDVEARAAASYLQYVDYEYPAGEETETKRLGNNNDIQAYTYSGSVVFGEGGIELATGEHQVSFKTLNYTGLEGNTDTTVYIDNEAPVLELKSLSTGEMIDENNVYIVGDSEGETVEIIASDAKSGLTDENIQATIQEENETSATPVMIENRRFTVKKPGYYTCVVTAADNLGNDVTKTAKFRVDNVEPKVSIEAEVHRSDGSVFIINGDDDIVYTGGETIDVIYTVLGFDIDSEDLKIDAELNGEPIVVEEISEEPFSDGEYRNKKITAKYTIHKDAANQGTYNFAITAKKHFAETDFNPDNEKQLQFVYDIEAPGSISASFKNYKQKVGNIYYYTENPTISVSAEDNYNIVSYKIYDENDMIVASGDINSDNGKIENKTIRLTGDDIEKNKQYNIRFSMTDKAGNESEPMADMSFVIDTVNPTARISELDENGRLSTYWNKSNVTITAEGTDNFVVTSFKTEVIRDGKLVAEQEKDVKNPSPSSEASFKYTREGVYEVRVYAVDAAGNTSLADTCAFVIDKKAPEISVRGIPANKLSKSASVKFTIKDEYGLYNNDITIVRHYTTYKGISGEKKLSVSKLDDFSAEASAVCNEVDGDAAKYWFTYTLKDRAGNTYNGKTETFYVDNTKPEVKISPVPSKKNDGYYNKPVKFDIDVVEQFELRHNIYITDREETVPDFSKDFKNPVYKCTIREDTQGAYDLEIVVTDAFGNATKKYVRYVIDQEKPVINIHNVNEFNNGDVNISMDITDKYKGDTYTIHAVRKDEAGNIVYEADMEKGKWQSTEVHPNVSFSEEGDYTVTVTAKDKAGNDADEKEVNFRIDKTAPVISITGVNDIQNSAVTATMSVSEAFSSTYSSGAASISATITKKTDGSAETNIATLSAGDFSGGNPRTASYSFNDDGEYTITVNATDACGNAAAAVTKTFKVDKDAPVLTVNAVDKDNEKIESYAAVGSSDAQTPNYVDVNVSVEEVFFHTNDVKFTVLKDGKDVSAGYFTNYANRAQVSTGSQRFDEDGVYNINIKAKDALGNEAEEYGIVFTVDNTPPSLEATDKLTALLSKKADGSKDILLNADDFSDIADKGYEALWTVNDTSVFTVDAKMDGVDFVDFSDLSDGQHKLEITVTDEVGHVSTDEFSFIYDGTAPRIIIQGIEDGDTVNEPFVLKISLEDSEDVINLITINGQTIDSSLYESSMTYEMNVTDYKNYEIRVDASDLAGNKSSTYDSEAGTVFSFSLKERISPIILVLIILAIVLLLAVIILIIMRSKKKNKR